MELVIKTRNLKMEHKFPLGSFHREKRDDFFTNSVYSGEFPMERAKTSCSVYIPTGISGIFWEMENALNLRVFWRHARLRPHLYGLGYPRQPSPRVTLGEVTFSLFIKINQTVYIRFANPSRVGELSHLAG